jgi:hypothetical protein
MKPFGALSLGFLFWVTIANYVAQIPYYLYNYYFPYHVLPTLSSIVLLGATLAWFLVGYVGVQYKWKYGYAVLITFLCIEALFYLHSFVFGAFFFQMQNPNPIIKSVFVVGYLSGAVAGYYVYCMVSSKMK